MCGTRHVERLHAYTLDTVKCRHMSQPETIYSAKQVAIELKISSGMLRRYALAYEAITGQKIYQDARDGRQYTADQLATLQRAKAFVGSNPGMSVDHALRLAMGASEADVIRSPIETKGIDTEALTGALERVVSPLVDEIRALRESNERLRVSIEGKSPSHRMTELSSGTSGRDSSNDNEPSQNQDGFIVRAARRLERLLSKR